MVDVSDTLVSRLQAVIALLDEQKFEAAEDECSKLRSEFPEEFDVLHLSGVVAQSQDDHQAAKGYIESALTIRKDVPSAHINLARVYKSLGQAEMGLTILEQAVDRISGNLDLLTALKQFAHDAARPEIEIRALEELHRLKPSDADLLVRLAWLEMSMGDIEHVEARLIEAIRLDPSNVSAHYRLSFIHRYSPSDPLLESLIEIANAEVMSSEDRVQLYFALGKAYDSFGEFESASMAFDKANMLKRQTLDYDPQLTDGQFQAVKESFEALDLDDPSQYPFTIAPIFIVGLPRSGTTLTEQILAQHSYVHAAGEKLTLKHLMRDACAELGLKFPEQAGQIPSDTRLRLAKAYLKDVASREEGKTFVTDKLPANFMYVGLIRWLFPNAKILHCVRDIRDSCLSIYQNYFPGFLPFAYDQLEIGHYGKSYMSLMAYWHDVLPEFVYDLEYQKLVSDFEPSVRSLLEFCGLPFETACLDFQVAQNRVRTLSVAQVRQPVSEKSVGRWQRYEDYIQPLLKALDQNDG